VRSKTVLVVDDSAIMRRIVVHHLHGLGFAAIREAADGAGALAILRAEKVDLVISDWCMRGMHGIDLLRAVRADGRLAPLPFIMLTAEGQPHSMAEARAAKVDRYVLKPFTREALARSVREVLGPSVRHRD
jgi:two-component system, chemotaxis family, chemotaxis protein CheY